MPPDERSTLGLLSLSSRGWGRVVLVTVVGTLICIAAATSVDSFTFPGKTASEVARALLVDTLLPTCLAAPMLLFLMTKLRELAIAKHELTILASTDSLTAVLNRGAFRMIVDSYLERVAQQQASESGSLLVVDVDHFKRINDRLGHDRGDVALKLIAGAIQSAVREIDLVGRLGGEEFGVFLPGSNESVAKSIAERIRASVEGVELEIDGSRLSLSVSVGGATFQHHVLFDDLFRAADQRLYQAKTAGRNRVELELLAA